jgi:hypothetical protein
LQGGRTFITNGPALFVTVDDHLPGDTIVREPGEELAVSVSWKSHYAIHRVDIVWNGKVAAFQQFPKGCTEGHFETGVKAVSDGWIAARLGSTSRDSFLEPIYAHTSPVYIVIGVRSEEERLAAAQFDRAIAESLERVSQTGRFRSDSQRQEVLSLFRRGQEVYRKLLN